MTKQNQEQNLQEFTMSYLICLELRNILPSVTLPPRPSSLNAVSVSPAALLLASVNAELLLVLSVI